MSDDRDMIQEGRRAFLALKSRKKVEPVEVEGQTFYVHMLSAEDRDGLEISMRVGEGKNLHINFGNYRARVICACLCLEDGTPLFSVVDLPQVGQLPAAVIEPIFDAAVKLNKLGAASVEEAEKNSVPTLNGSSASDSPIHSESQ